MSESSPEGIWRPRVNPWVVALTVTLATFMEVLDTSIANVALPHIAGSLAASQSEATWIISSYLVSNAVVLPISAYLATLFGRKRFYMTCVGLFGVSSLLCGIAPNLPLLLLFRVLQGLGGGGLATSEQAILADTFEPAKRGQAFALYGLAVVLAPAIGPLVGGWITDSYSWRWIFFINVPVAVVSILLTDRFVEDPPALVALVKKARSGARKIDYAGFVLVALSFGSLEVILDKGQEDDWFSSSMILGFTCLCVIASVALLIWEIRLIRSGKKPIVDLTLFQGRTFLLSIVLMFVLGFVLYGTTVLIPQFLQALMGYTATNAGMALSLGGVATLLVMPLVGFLINKLDARYLLAFGFLLSAVALFHMRSLNFELSAGHVASLRFFQALSFGFLFIPIQTLSYVGVQPEKNNDVSGLTNLARNIGGSVGTAFVTTFLARQSQRHQTYLGAHLTGNEISLQGFLRSNTVALFQQGVSSARTEQAALAQLYQQLLRQAQLLSYIEIISIFSVASALMVPLAFVMRKPTGGGAAMH